MEALTVKSQSLFLYQESAHWSFRIMFDKINAANTRMLVAYIHKKDVSHIA